MLCLARIQMRYEQLYLLYLNMVTMIYHILVKGSEKKSDNSLQINS